MQAFGIAASNDLMVDYDHSVLFCDLDVVQLLELGERKPAAFLPQRHKLQIRYSDKKRVTRFRAYATDIYEKRGVARQVHALIGDLALDGALTELGRAAREADAAAGWGVCHWRPDKRADITTIRGKTDEAMRPLGDFATQADVDFQSTHGSYRGAAIRAAVVPNAVRNGLVAGGDHCCTAHSNHSVHGQRYPRRQLATVLRSSSSS